MIQIRNKELEKVSEIMGEVEYIIRDIDKTHSDMNTGYDNDNKRLLIEWTPEIIKIPFIESDDNEPFVGTDALNSLKRQLQSKFKTPLHIEVNSDGIKIYYGA